ncbi:hypothetical protein M8542_47880 [Amycolatopsis sp. OK19-0408]|uniref:Uncharacterized protein n=1 Tax=Amycolatopsis iheyensis TaxID=2945988 RepID=A0A9X2NMZ1_9PSEU|nr:hypothetical protein [Amycolatopsis iheyensis]MCR6490548.1 hypothetical protein [Amycolatopsis iheyensis]
MSSPTDEPAALGDDETAGLAALTEAAADLQRRITEHLAGLRRDIAASPALNDDRPV